MRHFILILQILFLTDSAIAADDRGFAEKFLSSMYTEDDSVYRSLLHPAMNHCANRMWIKKSGIPPSEFEYKITDPTPQTIKNEQGMARMVGLSDTSFPIEPTHEIQITTDYVTV